MQANPEQSADYCRELVRQLDNDRYLAATLIREPQREHIWALYAFDAEIARVRSVVSEPSLGEIRFQWWLDGIDAIYNKQPVEHPVLAGLAEAISDADLPRHAFVNLIEARRFDLYDDPMPTLNDLEGYLGETSSMIMQLACQVLAGEVAYGLSDVTGHAGVAYGLTQILCRLPQSNARGQCFLPVALLEKYDLTPAHVLSGRREQGIDVVLTFLRHHVQKRLAEARERMSLVPSAALPALWPASLGELYLNKISGSVFNPLKRTPEVSQIRRQLRLMKLSYSESF